MDKTFPRPTLVAALLIAFARLSVFAAGHCLLSESAHFWTRKQRLGQLVVSVFLCGGAVMAACFTYRRFNDIYTRQAVSLIFASLMVAECYQQDPQSSEALKVIMVYLRMTPLLSGLVPAVYFPLLIFLPLFLCYMKSVSENFQSRVSLIKCYTVMVTTLIMLAISLAVNFLNPPRSGLIVGVTLNILLLMLFPYDVAVDQDVWEAFKIMYFGSRSDIELGKASESEIPIRNEVEMEQLGQEGQMNEEISSSAVALCDATTLEQMVTVRLHFTGSRSELEHCLHDKGFNIDAVPEIVALGTERFDVAVSEPTKSRLTATMGGFEALHTRLGDDELAIKYGMLRACSRMLASYMQVVPREQSRAWHTSNINQLRDKLVQLVQPSALIKDFISDMRSGILSSPKYQDIYVGLLCLFTGHTYVVYRSEANVDAQFVGVRKDDRFVRLDFRIDEHEQFYFKVSWDTAFELEEVYGVYLRPEVSPGAASILRIQAWNTEERPQIFDKRASMEAA